MAKRHWEASLKCCFCGYNETMHHLFFLVSCDSTLMEYYFNFVWLEHQICLGLGTEVSLRNLEKKF